MNMVMTRNTSGSITNGGISAEQQRDSSIIDEKNDINPLIDLIPQKEEDLDLPQLENFQTPFTQEENRLQAEKKQQELPNSNLENSENSFAEALKKAQSELPPQGPSAQEQATLKDQTTLTETRAAIQKLLDQVDSTQSFSEEALAATKEEQYVNKAGEGAYQLSFIQNLLLGMQKLVKTKESNSWLDVGRKKRGVFSGTTKSVHELMGNEKNSGANNAA